MATTADGTFDVTITPAAPVMPTAGDRAEGAAGEAAVELAIEPDGTHRFQLTYEQ